MSLQGFTFHSRALCSVFALLLLAGCGEEGADKPYVEFAGGGFVFNYNIAEAYYGFVVQVQRRIPEGTVLEAEFENPAGGDPLVVRHTAVAGRAEYVFRTPGVQGVEAGRTYQVDLRLLHSGTGNSWPAIAKRFGPPPTRPSCLRCPQPLGQAIS